jgi:hypothetical protein
VKIYSNPAPVRRRMLPQTSNAIEIEYGRSVRQSYRWVRKGGCNVTYARWLVWECLFSAHLSGTRFIAGVHPEEATCDASSS